ncbi:hypothetical protein [Natronosalvus rutilus]|uniref:Uncharacterized protein n=1 Tax=Natronosalvus rutilus TaxID=2953753 RepID=A0A9E7SZD0_9EURY|nr:hypothetical protein [Natronosalvus rutilus]UTF55828.1 hypothetical protein NGM29_20305 [Natronosalvus rutilus]
MSPSPSTETVAASSSSNTQPDYSALEIPAEKPLDEYHYTKRRAYLAAEIATAGHPDLVSRTEMADRFDVCHQQISKDIDRIASSVVERGRDRPRRALECETVVRKSIKGLLEDEEWKAAANLALDYEEWLVEFYDLEAVTERLDALEAGGDR